MMQQFEPGSLLNHNVATMTSDYIIATMISDITVAFDTTVAFVIPFVTLLTSTPVMWREENSVYHIY
jgi:hypothetical protein